MTKRMLIDDTQPEETRVVIVDGNKVEDVEFESSCRKQIKGNIYTAKVIRVEPSLQAAFVDYGGNKHGFLAFSEIHPDYYNIAPEMVEAVEREVDEIIERKKQYIKEREEQREKIRAEKKALYEARKREEEERALAEEKAKALEAMAKIGEISENAETQDVLETIVEDKVADNNVVELTKDDVKAEETPVVETIITDEPSTESTVENQTVTEEETVSNSAPAKPKRKYTRRKKNVSNENKETTENKEISEDKSTTENKDTNENKENEENLKVLASVVENKDESVCEEVKPETDFEESSSINENDEDAISDNDDDDDENDFELQRKLIKARKLYHYSTIQDVPHTH